MEVYIEVVAMDREAGVKKTIKQTVEVPPGVLKVHQMFAEDGDRGKLVTAVAQSVYSAARKELDASRKNSRTAIHGAVSRGGRIGGNRAATRTPAAAPTVEQPQSQATQPKGDPLADALGLDIIEHMGAQERGAQMQPGQPRPTAPAAPAPSGPSVGFPTGHPGHRPSRGP